MIQKFTSAITGWGNKSVAVIGDLIYDLFEYGHTTRISSENSARTPVVSITGNKKAPGGAGNVAANIVALGGNASLFSVIGDGHSGASLIDLVRSSGVRSGVVVDKTRQTTRKIRVYSDTSELVCLAYEDTNPISQEIEDKLLENLKESTFEIVIISDYGRGVITPTLVQKVLALCEPRGVKVLLDAKPRKDWLSVYRGVWLIKPNDLEANQMTQIPVSDHESALRAGKLIANILSVPNVLVTRGPNGMSLCEKSEQNDIFSDVEIQPYGQDLGQAVCVSGAGDTVISTIALSLTANLSLNEAAQLSMVTSALVVRREGTATIQAKEVLAQLQRAHGS